MALSLLATGVTGADAGNGRGHGHGHGKHWRESRQVVVRPARRVRAVRVYAAAPRPRYVSYRSPRVVVVRPAPYVRIGARIGSVDIGAVFGGGRRYANYAYGCNFCEARFSSFDAYDDHVHDCSHRPHDVEIRAQAWDDEGYGEWRGRDATDCGDDRYDDRGYDDRGYDDRDDN